MRLLSFRPKRGGAARLGLLRDSGGVIDIGAAAVRARIRLPFDAGDMIYFIYFDDEQIMRDFTYVSTPGYVPE